MANSELTVVVPTGYGDRTICDNLDSAIGYRHDRHYTYGRGRDVVYYIPEADIERVGRVLDELTFVHSYNFNNEGDDGKANPL
jgi:hypothetical protein